MHRGAGGPLVIRREPGDPEWFPEAIAVYTGYWAGEKRLVIAMVVEGRRGVYIVPPVPSPFCGMKFSLLEEQVLKTVLDRIGSRYVSGCRVSDALVSDSLSDTLNRLVEEGLLDCVGAGCETRYVVE